MQSGLRTCIVPGSMPAELLLDVLLNMATRSATDSLDASLVGESSILVSLNEFDALRDVVSEFPRPAFRNRTFHE